jgi:chromosome partitioning protein
VRTIASYHHKGGVGKTTTAVALAANAADTGHRTLLWDLDPQGSATRLVGADRGSDGGVQGLLAGGSLLDGVLPTSQEGLEVFPADLSLRRLDRALGDDGREHLRAVVQRAADRYDVVVLDCPPSVSELAAAVLYAADLVVVPLTAGPLAWSAYADLYAEIDAMGMAERPRLLAFLTMVDRRKGLHRDLADWETPPDGFSAVTVPTDSRVERMAIDPHPFRAVLTGRAGEAYSALWAEVADAARTTSTVG